MTRVRGPKTSRSRQTRPRRKTALKKQIVVKRSSGRVEKFDTNRLAQTVSRSGVPFLMARGIAKTLVEKTSSKDLDLTEYSDSYAKELRSLVLAKIKGKPIVTKHEPRHKDAPTNLLAALRASMQVKKSKK